IHARLQDRNQGRAIARHGDRLLDAILEEIAYLAAGGGGFDARIGSCDRVAQRGRAAGKSIGPRSKIRKVVVSSAVHRQLIELSLRGCGAGGGPVGHSDRFILILSRTPDSTAVSSTFSWFIRLRLQLQ